MGGYLPVRRVAGLAADSDAVAASTTLVDSDLSIAVEKDRVYRFRAHLFLVSNETADAKVDLSVPAGSSGYQHAGDAANGDTPDAVGTEVVVTVGAGETEAVAVVEGVLTAGADGNVTVQFAQNTSNAVETKLLAGSYLELEEY